MKLLHADFFENSSGESRLFWESLNNARLFLAGGTGFFGTSLLEGLVWARQKFGIQVQTTVLTRNKNVFLKRFPNFQDQSWLSFCEGHLANFEFPNEQFSHIIHGASAVAMPGQNEDLEVENALIEGTKHLLKFATSHGAERFLYVSSGAVYGSTSNPENHYAEKLKPMPNTAYGRGKYKSELLCQEQETKSSIGLTIARGFAFVGPFLPLDAHFAIGNFINHAIQNKPIIISSDGTALRSYLHSADLVTWLMALLTKAKPGETYNVGSDKAISIYDLAQLVANEISPGLNIKVLKTAVPGQAPQRYIPSVSKIKSDFQVTETVGLKQAIRQFANSCSKTKS
jgi:dTDP-glucose 4,6-dehydratase